MSEYYKSNRPVDGKPPILVIVDKTGKVVNRNPSKEELCGLRFFKDKERLKRPKNGIYSDTNICVMIKEDGNVCGMPLVPGNAYQEHDKSGNETGRWICRLCHTMEYSKHYYRRYDSIRNTGARITRNQDPDSSVAKGDMFQKLANVSKNLVCLNETNDNHHWHMDSVCPITKFNYQIKGRWYDPINRNWTANLKNEHNAIKRGFRFFKLIFYCASKDGKKIERLYEFPEEEVVNRKGITIMKNPTDSLGRSIISWYVKYRITDEEELKRINDIWKDIIEKSSNLSRMQTTKLRNDVDKNP